MALAPISVRLPSPPVQRADSAPGRPDSTRERLPVAGRPQAELQRPAHSPGRIPVGDDRPGNDAADRIEQIDKQVRESREYQAIKAFLPERAERAERDESARRHERHDDHDHHHEIENDAPPPPPELAQPTQPPATAPNASPGANGAPVQKSDPLALDLDGNGLETRGVDNGVRFDIDADGRLDHTSFVSGGDAFLALDRNGNGRIDDGAELFGDQRGHANGFAALAEHDDNRDGLIDASDSVFTSLRLFSLADDGSQQLRSLSAAGVQAIRLAHSNVDVALNRYDSIAQAGSFVRDDGSEGQAGDLLLGHRQLTA